MIDDLPKEECGVFAVVAPGRDVSRLTFYALHALQHRGQESAGIAVSDAGHVTVQRDLGLVSGVFDEPSLRSLTGDTVNLRIHDPYADGLFHNAFELQP